MRISLDAPNSEIYKRIRGSDKFDQIIKGIQLINKRKKERNANITLRLEYVLQNDNVDSLIEFISLAKNLEIEYINFQVISNTIDSTDEFRKALVNKIQQVAFRNKLQEALDYATQLRIKTNLQNLLTTFNIIWKCHQSEMKPNMNLSHECIQLWISVMVTADSQLLLCCKLRDPDMSAGNIIDNYFYSIWNNKKFMEFRQNLRKSKNIHFSCNDCIPTSIYRLIHSQFEI